MRRWGRHHGLCDFDLLLYVYEERRGLSVDLEHGWMRRLGHLFVELGVDRLLLALYLVYVAESLLLLCIWTSA